MSKEQAQRKLQELAAEIKLIVDQMTGLAQANGITSVEVFGGCLQFGVNFDGSVHSVAGTARYRTGYHAAKGGAVFTDYEWRGSHFECFPGSLEREWLFGKDTADWPKTDYEDE